MALKTNLFFIVLLFIVALSAGLIDTTGQKGVLKEEVPTIEFQDFEIYKIAKDGVTESLFADRGLHYANKDILFNGFIYKGRDGKIDGINGDKITIRPREITIDGNGKFISTEGYEISSQQMVYNLDNKVVSTNGRFLITQELDTIEGENLWIDLNKKIIKATTVKARIELNNLKN